MGLRLLLCALALTSATFGPSRPALEVVWVTPDLAAPTETRNNADFQAALDTCDTMDGCVIRFQSGTWDDIEWNPDDAEKAKYPNGIVIECQDRDTTILRMPLQTVSDGVSMFELEAFPYPTVIRRCTLDGRKSEQPNQDYATFRNDWRAISAHNVFNTRHRGLILKDLVVRDFVSGGFELRQVDEVLVEDVTFQNLGCNLTEPGFECLLTAEIGAGSRDDNTADAIAVQFGAGAGSGTVRRVTVDGVTKIGLEVLGSVSGDGPFLFEDSTITRAYGEAMTCVGRCESATFRNNVVEDSGFSSLTFANSGHGFYARANCVNLTVQGNTFRRNDATPITAICYDASANVQILDNVVEGSNCEDGASIDAVAFDIGSPTQNATLNVTATGNVVTSSASCDATVRVRNVSGSVTLGAGETYAGSAVAQPVVKVTDTVAGLAISAPTITAGANTGISFDATVSGSTVGPGGSISTTGTKCSDSGTGNTLNVPPC